ncbi:MAG: thiamine-monophosphate kinase [Candidatus Marinimicrobia bacterium]|nr:thiamine-monophosphate kinase [Candidatus Neomarinimicrobiota bacterium]
MLIENNILSILNHIISGRCKSLDKNIQDSVSFRAGSDQLLFTIDDFSEEDQFRENRPDAMGWNMVMGATSDILAAGGTPKYIGHSLVVQENWSEDYITRLAQGMADAIKTCGMTFIGGDLGRSERWNYTASVIGEAPDRALNRLGARPGDRIYLSGKIGAGNFEAALKLYEEKLKWSGLLNSIKIKFPFRLAHAGVMKDFASCAIDTSDGVFNGLNTLSSLNGVGYEVQDLPTIAKATLLAKFLSLPKELLFLGECGEYELLFCVNEALVPAFELESTRKNLVFYPLGRITEKGNVLHTGKGIIDLETFDIRARDFVSVKEYLDQLVKRLRV